MAHDVTCTLEQVMMQEGNMSLADATAFITTLRDQNRFHEDIFGVSIRRPSEQVERSKDQSMRALQYLNATVRPSKPNAVKEKAVPITPTSKKRPSVGKP